MLELKRYKPVRRSWKNRWRDIIELSPWRMIGLLRGHMREGTVQVIV